MLDVFLGSGEISGCSLKPRDESYLYCYRSASYYDKHKVTMLQ